MPTSMYIESPDSPFNKLKPKLDGSVDVNVTNQIASVTVSNLPAVQAVSGTVAVSNLPATQAVSGTVAVSNFPASQTVNGTVSVNQPVTISDGGGSITVDGALTAAPSIPAAGDIVRASLDATGTLYTVPAGRVFMGSVSLAACVAVAGNSQPTISTPAGTIHKITINGLALSSVASANTISDVYIHGGASGVAVTFTQGASGTSSGQIAGRLL